MNNKDSLYREIIKRDPRAMADERLFKKIAKEVRRDSAGDVQRDYLEGGKTLFFTAALIYVIAYLLLGWAGALLLLAWMVLGHSVLCLKYSELRLPRFTILGVIRHTGICFVWPLLNSHK